MTGTNQPVRTRALTVAILAGGRSSRMGTDKAFLRLRPDGPTFLEQTIAIAARVADDVIVIGPLDRGYQASGADVVPDVFPGGGVLGGIATGLMAAPGHDLFVVACDHPFLSEPLIRHLTSLDGDFDVAAPRTVGASRQGGDRIIQTLHATYRPSCLPALERLISRGYASSMDFFHQVKLREVDESELRVYDPLLRSLMSVNTPEALERARAIAIDTENGGGRVDYTQQSK